MSFSKFSGERFLIALTFIDSGYRPEMVYPFCQRHPGTYPAKGHKERNRPLSNSTIDHKGKFYILWHIDDGYFKSWVHGRIRRPEGDPGGWHISRDVTEDYCQQVVSEQLTRKPSGKLVWIKTQKANHYLDCELLVWEKQKTANLSVFL